MQSIFRLPWSSEHLGSKMADKASLDKMRATPIVEIPVLNKLKRKRAGSPDGAAHDWAKRPRHELAPAPAVPSANVRPAAKPLDVQTGARTNDNSHIGRAEIPPEEFAQTAPISAKPVSDARVKDEMSEQQSSSLQEQRQLHTLRPLETRSDDSTGLSPLQQIIQNEFNVQILMKHNELRLIEQELAKCQIALEQLRRCELRPFPGNHQPSESLSAGVGPSVEPPPGYTRPDDPAPYGVTDGPYTRHYRSWLLQDPQFDATPLQSPFYSEAYGPGSARSTRNTASARSSASKTFTHHSRPSDTLQSIPNYPPPPPKDKSAPLVLRRSTDGQLVKLICNNCNRGNFSSIQGFLNHCRIAHKVDYKSHDAAAIDCGRLLDEHELATLGTETQSSPVAKPTVSRAATNTTTTPHRNLVHPLNTQAGLSTSLSRPQHHQTPRTETAVPSLNTLEPSTHPAPFTPSPQLPHLSAHFAKHRLGGDLASLAANAKQKVDLGADDELLHSPDTPEHSPASSLDAVAAAGPSRTVIGGSGIIARPASAKGFRLPALQSQQQQQRPRPSPLTMTPAAAAGMQQSDEIPDSPPEDRASNLSPADRDSNPGLVSDHEDDHASASDSDGDEGPSHHHHRPPLPVGVGVGVGRGEEGRRDCSEHLVELDVAVDGDDMDENGVVIRRNSLVMREEEGRPRGFVRGKAQGSPSRKAGGGGGKR